MRGTMHGRGHESAWTSEPDVVDARNGSTITSDACSTRTNASPGA